VAEELEWQVVVEERTADPEGVVEAEDPILEEEVVVEMKTSQYRLCDGWMVLVSTMAGRRSEVPTTTGPPSLALGQTVVSESTTFSYQRA
jgi:hypothetical protein